MGITLALGPQIDLAICLLHYNIGHMQRFRRENNQLQTEISVKMTVTEVITERLIRPETNLIWITC